MTRDPSPSGTRAQQREQTRARLLRAALEHIRRDGLDAARIDEIAADAGVSRATFYFHFPSKEDVLLSALADSEARVSARLAGLPDDADAATVLAATSDAIADEWRDDPALLREVGTVALRATAAALPQGTGEHAVRDALVPRLEAAIRRGEIVGGIPAPLMAELFLVGLFAAATAWTRQPLLPLPDLLHSVVHFFLRGAAPPSA